jgi:hypothetical protein
MYQLTWPPEDSPAFEKPFSDLHDKPYSLFTQSLVRLLEAENFGSYRELGEALILKQAALPGHVPTPIIEGDLDQPTFDGTALGPRVWQAEYDETSGQINVRAGSLQGITPGSILSFEKSEGLIGYGQIGRSDILSSSARPQEFYDKPRPSPDNLRGKLVAKVIRSAVDLTLSVAALPASDNDGSKAWETGSGAIDLLKEDKKSPLPLHWVKAGMMPMSISGSLMGLFTWCLQPENSSEMEGDERPVWALLVRHARQPRNSAKTSGDS